MHQTVETETLDNGLRVLVLPDPAASVVAVAVHYDVGWRSEPEGSTGFAHLFEHLMFQGSEHLDKGDLPRLIQGNGGLFNGMTRPDATVYFEQLPPGGLELALFCEADRMRAPRITEENLANQIAVVKEEIRVNVLNQPYGGFPWLDLPPLLFTTFANSHNGYGSFEDLETATVDDARRFFDSYYAPGNAVLTIAGGVDARDALRLAAKHFAGVPPREVPTRPSFGEPLPRAERRSERVDELAPLPAVALGYRVPDPVGDAARFAATVVLADLLTSGPASRLFDRLVRRDKLAAEVGAMWGGLDSAWTVRDPTYLAIVAHYPEARLTDTIVSAVDAELESVSRSVDHEELSAVLAQTSSAQWMALDVKYALAILAGSLEQQRGSPELAFELTERLRAAAPLVPEVAAEWLRPDARVVLTLLPGSAAGVTGPAMASGSAA